IDPDVVFHEPINPRGKNFEMCIDALREHGHENAAKQFERLTDPDKWVEYALEQIDLVQQKSAQFDNLEVHTWPDNQLIEVTKGEVNDQLIRMKRSVSPESIGQSQTEKSNRGSQAPLNR
ncbi:MAG: hypothetical protein ABEI86_03905, partial [Halobacteriaceae archaeon]